MRAYARLCLLLSAAFVLVACSRASSSEGHGQGGLELAELRYQSLPGQVTFAELAEDLGYLAPLELKQVGTTISGPQDIQSVATGDIDFGLAFNGAILKLAAAKAPIQAVIGGYGVDKETFQGFYVLEGSPIKTPRDLIGKKIAVNTLGAHSEFMVREYLHRNGLTQAQAKQVELMVLPPVNTEQALRQGQIDVAALGSIFRDKAVERGGLRVLFSDFDLYGEFTAGCYVVNKRLLAQAPKTVGKFVEGVAKAIEWARRTPRAEVVAREEQLIAKRKRNEDGSIVKYYKSTGIAGRGGLIADTEFKVWLDWLVRDGDLRPGQLTLSDVFTNQFNPARDGKL